MKLIHSVHKYDVFIFNCLINFRIYRYLAICARYISSTGDGYLYLVLSVLVSWFDKWDSLFLQIMLLAFLIERPVYFILKNGFRRNRPAAALKGFSSLVTPSDQFSFPSGHTSAAFMMAIMCGYFVPVLLFPLLLWAALVGFSRVLLGVHFPTDTLVGMLLGTSVALFSISQVMQSTAV